MFISYKKLWKLIIDKDMKKRDLKIAANLSTSTLSQLTHCENVNTAVLLMIYEALQCGISDIMEVVPETGVGGGVPRLNLGKQTQPKGKP